MNVDVKALGLTVVSLGGGRRLATDRIDHSVGLADIAVKGQAVGPDQPLTIVHAANENAWLEVSSKIIDAYEVGSEAPDVRKSAILGREADE